MYILRSFEGWRDHIRCYAKKKNNKTPKLYESLGIYESLEIRKSFETNKFFEIRESF